MAEQLTELREQTCILALGSPFVSGLALRKSRQLGRIFAIVEQLIHRNFQGACELLQRLNCRNGMSMLHTGDIAAKQTCPLLDLALRELLFLTQRTQTISDNQGSILLRI